MDSAVYGRLLPTKFAYILLWPTAVFRESVSARSIWSSHGCDYEELYHLRRNIV
jgi:hypothetical protein